MATLDSETLARYDPEVAERFLETPGAMLTGLPKYRGIEIVDVGPGTLRAEMSVITADAKIVSMTRSTAVVLIEASDEGRLVRVSRGSATIRPPHRRGARRRT